MIFTEFSLKLNHHEGITLATITKFRGHKEIWNALSTLEICQFIIQVWHVRQIEVGQSSEEDTYEVIRELYVQTLNTVEQSVRYLSIHLLILINKLVMHLIFEQVLNNLSLFLLNSLIHLMLCSALICHVQQKFVVMLSLAD